MLPTSVAAPVVAGRVVVVDAAHALPGARRQRHGRACGAQLPGEVRGFQELGAVVGVGEVCAQRGERGGDGDVGEDGLPGDDLGFVTRDAVDRRGCGE